MRDKNHSERPSRWRGASERRPRLPKLPGNDRRSVIRYPLNLRLRYSVSNPLGGVPQAGSGYTLDLSSSSLRFVAERPLTLGVKLDLFVEWPFLLDGDVELQLTASGKVIRVNGNETVLRIHRHDFKTRGRWLQSSLAPDS